MPRIEVLKTYKLFIGGQFPRTESGRYYTLKHKDQMLANMCLASRKDFRNAVQSARAAFPGWSLRTGFQRSQILYRMAEMLEARKAQFEAELSAMGIPASKARQEVQQSIDTCVYYSGWCDKYQALYSSVNPVNATFFNFSLPEPMGVISMVAPEEPALLGLLQLILPAIAGGNTLVILASEQKALCAITLAEVMASSDLPGGVVNILSGKSSELHSHFASHMDVNAIVYARENVAEEKTIQELSAHNVKRCILLRSLKKWKAGPERIFELQEVKTTWHPIETPIGGGAKY
ncbi:MAG TPA: aldehyde dehydrogenase family protein [Chitinophagaceae bacterium]|nr:aldehyde dehydrogenase family protein [Chitinophagaceae bacterium]